MALRRLIAVAGVHLLAASAGFAASLPEPGYYRVTGVATKDVLNIRQEPDAKSPIIGELAHDARPIEVLETVEEGGSPWGRVHAADSSGWVAMKFLAPHAVALVAGTQAPEGLSCAGTEPFWSASLAADGGIEFAEPDADKRNYSPAGATTAVGRDSRFALFGRSGGGEAILVLARGELCSDGMSDRDFNWRADLLLRKGDGTVAAYEGCCLLPPRK
jgi:uncharacterized membrane protein